MKFENTGYFTSQLVTTSETRPSRHYLSVPILVKKQLSFLIKFKYLKIIRTNRRLNEFVHSQCV